MNEHGLPKCTGMEEKMYIEIRGKEMMETYLKLLSSSINLVW